MLTVAYDFSIPVLVAYKLVAYKKKSLLFILWSFKNFAIVLVAILFTIESFSTIIYIWEGCRVRNKIVLYSSHLLQKPSPGGIL